MQLIDAAPLMRFPHPIKVRWKRRILHFRKPATTSRGALAERVTYTIEAITYQGSGYGECCIMPGLLPTPTAEEMDYWCREVEQRQGLLDIQAPSPIQFGLECALMNALQPDKAIWDTPFSRGEESIPIHHLIWMDTADNMLKSMEEGILMGFNCLKMKVGALPFEQEIELLRHARDSYPHVELRLDANGAFSQDDVLHKLNAIAELNIAYIEQPIRPGQWRQLADLCQHSPIPIALDEELIGADVEKLLDTVHPQAIVIKPSLHGGLIKAQNWALQAESRNIDWWVNSALESNTGLDALAEWSAYAAPGKLQGLSKGNLFIDDAPGKVHLLGNSLKMEEI